jgi:hypothetical protein
MTCVLLLGAGGSAAANVLDALRGAGRPYRVVGADASHINLHLSRADVRLVVPRAGDRGYGDAIVAAVDDHGCDMVHAQPDPDVRALGAIRERIPAATYLPAQEALEVAADKLVFVDRMRRAGVAVPDSAAYASLADVAPVTDKLLAEHERVWIRARFGAGARASLPVRSGSQAEAWVRWWVDERGLAASDFMASEFLPARERLEYLYGHLTPSGQTSTPAVARTVREPAVDDLALAAIGALDPLPRGVYCVDVKESAEGEPKVTEINAGRFFTTSNFLAAAGLNMPDLLVRCALGERPPRAGSSPLPPDLFWIRMVDMGYALVPGDDIDPWTRPRR